MKEIRKHVDEMKKEELKFELENVRYEYDKMLLKAEIVKMLDRMVTTDELKQIKDYVEKIYKNDIAGDWGFLFGVRDNIVDMVNNLADKQKAEELQYFNQFMYRMLLERESNATEGLYTVTNGMEKALLEHLLNKKAV